MDTVTYPDAKVTEFIEQHFSAARVRTKDNPQLLKEYSVSWTPNVVITDTDGTVHYRVEGFLQPHEFLARLSLGAGKFYLDHDRYDDAARRFEEVGERHAGSEAGAEGLYWLGVARFKKDHDKSQLQTSWQRLAQDYPDSVWTQRSKIPKA